MAIYHRDDRAVQGLLKEGVAVNAPNESGDTSLMAACEHHTPKIVRLLLDRGADISAKNKNGESALDLAAWYCVACAKLLISRGAKTNQHNLDTALVRAVESRDVDGVKFLLHKGANPNTHDDFIDCPVGMTEEEARKYHGPHILRLARFSMHTADKGRSVRDSEMIVKLLEKAGAKLGH